METDDDCNTDASIVLARPRPGMKIVEFSKKGEMWFAFNETMVVHEELKELTLKT